MESEIRYYFSSSSENKIIEYLKNIKDIKYIGTFYEKTDQYNHPMKEYDFYNKNIDGRFRVRKTINDDNSKCMITWKRRLNKSELIHQEEEVEVSIDINEYDNMIFLLTNVLHLSLVESYERYRNIFSNESVEIVVDRYPFGIALEIENKSKTKDPIEILKFWLSKLKLDINDAYKLSWDDKYADLCKEQNKKIETIVLFDKDMPKVKKDFNN